MIAEPLSFESLAGEHTGPSLNVLIAEDDERQATPLKRVLEFQLQEKLTRLHIRVIAVSSLRDALVLAQDANATILDLTLSDAGQSEVLAAMRENKFRSPIIIRTGDDDPDLAAECKMCGASIVLVKAISTELDLCSAIIHCLTKDVLFTARNLER